jgi:hypothetical protein
MDAITKVNVIGAMTDFVESGAGNYWGRVRNVVRNDDDWIISFEVREDEAVDLDSSDSWHKITPQIFLDAINELKRNPAKYKVSPHYADWYKGEEWNNDADSDDIVVQIAALGEVIYG